MPYRILIPDELPYSSGVENVAIAIVSELLAKVDCVTWMRQDLGHIQRLKDRLGNPDNLNFIKFSEESPHSTKAKKSRLLDTLKETLKNIPLLQKKPRLRTVDLSMLELLEQLKNLELLTAGTILYKDKVSQSLMYLYADWFTIRILDSIQKTSPW